MTTTIELATVPSADTPGTCIYLHHDKRSYIFGRVGEGTQRAFGSRKIHMGGTEQVFLSGPVHWEQLGGLVGYLLSVGGAADAAREHQLVENSKRQQLGRKLLRQTEHSGVGIHGGDNLCHALATSRAVVFRQSISVRPYEQRDDPRSLDAQNTEADWVDDAVRVWKIPVRRSRSSSPTKRRRSSADRTNGGKEDMSKPATTLSDHNVAREIVEKIIFNGSLNNQSLLLPKKIGQLTEQDVAVTKQGSTLYMYSGPYATNGNTIPNADEDAWVFPDPRSTEPAPSYDDEGVLPINHFPLPRTKYGELSMSYIVKCHERRGKFNPAVAKSLGVDPKDFKLLTNNQNVTVADGSTVTPDMVLGEPQPGNGIAVADIPTVDFLGPFLQRPEWTNSSIMEHVAVIYWILGAELATNASLVKFMQDRPNIKHVLCAPNTCPNMITHPSSAEIHTRLRKVDAERFPIMTFDNKITYPAPEEDSCIELGRAGKRMTLMPRLVFDDQHIAPFADLASAFNSVDDEVVAMAEAAKIESTNPEFLARIEAQEQNIPNRDAEIVPLGTGSSVPSKHRNVSSTLIRVPGIGNYLLDCGEGTLGQIRRLYGDKETVDILRNLQCIVISHVHADHHLGTTSVIKAWYEQTLLDQSTAKLAISCIGRYRALLEELSQVEDIGFHRLRFPSCPYNTRDRDITTKEDLAEYEQDFGLAGIKRIPVPHCWRSYGTELELTSGLRIAYSGDCRPSSKFAKACLGAHLLVHECTFGDDKQDHARAKNHSTMAEALRVSKEMEARRTLLTHFSQRYAKSDSLRRERDDSKEQDVLLAFDLMRVKLGDFQKAACYIPAIEKLMEKLGE